MEKGEIEERRVKDIHAVPEAEWRADRLEKK